MTYFSPYHSFPATKQLEQKIETLKSQGEIENEIIDGYNRYHWALIYKLECAQYHIDRLATRLETTAIEQLTSENFKFDVNMFIDGFFYTSGSALDIIAREVLVYYGIFKNIVNLEIAKNELIKNNLGIQLQSQLVEPSWYKEFKDYRNALTHELIIANKIYPEITHEGNIQKVTIRIPLPDDPREKLNAYTFKNNPDVIVYMKNHFTQILKLINKIYLELNNEIKLQECLPLK